MKKTEPFQFKQFKVFHYRSSMKVGVDGVLIGAWGEIGGLRGLDIGCGCGLIALMALQRNSQCVVEGIDLDESSILEAGENFQKSPWSSRAILKQADAIEFAEVVENQEKYDFILSNPPFFRSGILAPSTSREIARHEGRLSPPSLLNLGYKLLKPGGTLSFIMPSTNWTETAYQGMQLEKKCLVSDRPGKDPKRVMLTFRKENKPCDIAEIATEFLEIRDSDGNYSEKYKKLTKDFYLLF